MMSSGPVGVEYPLHQQEGGSRISKVHAWRHKIDKFVAFVSLVLNLRTEGLNWLALITNLTFLFGDTMI